MVQKFGGTSLSTSEARVHVIKHIQYALQQGFKLVVVVSAMGRAGQPYATDTLLHWIKQNGNALPHRELDLLLGCGEIISAATLCSLLHAGGIASLVLTGPQAGIQTEGRFGNGKILTIDSSRIIKGLEDNKVVVITGFQGENRDRDLMTLGRGGSDTTATAVGSSIKAERIDIFTDVEGIMTSDPRIVKDAKPITVVTYAEICNMANHGAKVIHPRAVEIAMHANIPLRVRCTFTEDEGTLVTHPNNIQHHANVLDKHITGITYVSDVTQIQIQARQGQYDLQLDVFKAMAQEHISVDFINVNPSGMVYTVFDQVAERAIEIIETMGYTPSSLSHCSKISIIGGGMNGVPGIMADIVEALTEENIQILQSADSNNTIWILVKNEDRNVGLQTLHRKFKLHHD